MIIRKAERKKAKLRLKISGPSGSGKTLGALKLAKGLVGSWEKIVVIGTENGSEDLYSHLGDYSVLPLLAPFTPERYVEAIMECEKAGFDCIIIDSATHEWDGKGGCLEINEMIAKRDFKGNTWSAWSVTTPRHQKFIDTMINSKCHIIATYRSKTETVMMESKSVKKVGMKDVAREGTEYEFTLAFELDRDSHTATATKDRTCLYEGKDPFQLTEEVGEEIREWCESGKEVIPEPPKAEEPKNKPVAKKKAEPASEPPKPWDTVAQKSAVLDYLGRIEKESKPEIKHEMLSKGRERLIQKEQLWKENGAEEHFVYLLTEFNKALDSLLAPAGAESEEPKSDLF